MTKYSINPEADIRSIADAIREKLSTSKKYTVKQMPQAIKDIASAEPTPAVTVDSELNSESENPVQNKAINAAIQTLTTALNGKTDVIFVSSTDNYTAGTTPLETGRVAIVYEAD